MAVNGTITPYGARMTERILQANIGRVLPDITDACMRNFQMMALLAARGNIIGGETGFGFHWKVKFRNADIKGSNGERPRQYNQEQYYKTARLDFRGYEATDSISRQEMKRNDGETAIIRVMDEMVANLKKSMLEGLGPQFFGDGDAAGNEDFWHGFKTLVRHANQTLNNDGSGARAANAADKVIAPSGTYANLNTALGAYGGDLLETGVWPEPQAKAEYDFWSPLMLLWQGTGFTASTDTGEKFKSALRYGITHAQRNTNQSGQLSQAWTDRNTYIAMKDFYEGKQTLEVTAGTELYKLGFKNVIMFDGVEISFENAVPQGYTFGVNMDQVELRCLEGGKTAPGETNEDEQGFVLSVDGPEWDMDLQIFKTAIQTNSNLQFRSPRECMILVPNAAVGL